MKIEFNNIYRQDKILLNKIIKKTKKIIKKSNFILGEEVLDFEKKFSNFTKTKFCISCASGTDALYLVLKSLNLSYKDEVIVPAMTYVATASTVINAGCKLRLADVNLKDASINQKDIINKINSRTKAIIIVNLWGHCSDYQKLKKICDKEKIILIEDAAQSVGARNIKNINSGNIGHVACFSFFPGKNLGSFGDGGAIVTNSKKIYLYTKRARNHGALLKYDHKFPGRNSRLDTIQAAVLSLKLKNYKDVVLKRNKLANIYYKKFKNIKKIETFKLNKNNTTVYHQFVIRTQKRDLLKKFLSKNKIQTMIHYPYMLNELPFFKYKKKLKKSYYLGKKILSLPISEEHTEKEINYVANKVIKFFRK